jgi:hypothetical protein
MLLTAATLALAACGSDDPTPSPPSAGGGNSAAAPSDAAPPAADDCGGVAESLKQIVDGPVEDIEVVGQCTTVSIETSLGEDAKAEATSICDTAAKAAYVDDINSIRVLSASGTELSQGIKGAGCL